MTMEVLERYLLDAERAFTEERWLDGKEILEDALALEPTYGMAHNHMGWLYLYHLNDVERAERHLELAIKYAPKVGSVYNHMTSLLFNQARMEEHATLLERAGKVPNVDKPFLYNEWGRWHEVHGNYRRAIKNYKLAIRWSLNVQDLEVFKDNIRRCRNKRWLLLLG